MTKNHFLKGISYILIGILILTLTGCYSIFQGGASGAVVDSESTTSPKTGIANVDVYAYTSENARNTDYSSWEEGKEFVPGASYYGHTTTNNDGAFSLSKLLWKSKKPVFGKDGDVTKIYLLFYHENYGLTKGQSLIVSDSMSNTVYQELTRTRIVTNLNINFVDVATNQNTGNTVFVSISVPQTTENNPDAKAKVFSGVITGSGRLQVSYPRYQNASDKESNTETKPVVTVKYYQNAQEETWKACYNGDNAEKNYAFREDGKTGIDVEIGSGDYSLSFYGKATKLNMPVFSGQYSTSGELGEVANDGVIISMKSTGSSETDFSIDCGEVSTRAENLGNSEKQKHGIFSGLGQGITWSDTTYTGKYAETRVKFFVNGVENLEKTVKSNQPTYTVQLSN